MERELKLHVPLAVAKSLKKALIKLGAQPLELHASYFDTPDRDLARKGMALRIRREGSRWMQTLKAAGSDTLSKIEINHEQPTARLDMSLYAGSPVEDALSHLQDRVSIRYETEVTRLLTQVETADAKIEIAFDQGHVRAGSLSLAISELELELVSGNIQALFSLGQEWLQKYELIIDLRSKSERGDLLARSQDHASQTHRPLFKPRTSRAAQIEESSTIDQAYAACSAECLDQVIRNAAFVAGVDTQTASDELRAEYVHQLRVGMRRLRSCWKLFHEWVPEADLDTTRTLRKAFSRLGKVRDSDVLNKAIVPALAEAGMPPLRLPESHAVRPDKAQGVAGGPQCQAALLTLLARTIQWGDEHNPSTEQNNTALAQNTPQRPHIESPATANPLIADAEEFAPRALNRLTSWFSDIMETGRQFGDLSITRQHGLRNKIKTLRYALDLCAPVLAAGSLANSRKELAHAQDVLGDLNDMYVADERFMALVKNQPEAWFAVGWLRAMQGNKQQAIRHLFLALDEAYSPTTAVANSRATNGCKSSRPSPTPIQ